IFIDKSDRGEIEKQFLESDMINENLPIIKEKFHTIYTSIYTSKPLNTLEISKRLSNLNLNGSKSVGIEIQIDF
ncbi:990_t:CDS:1, partial [Dentiscutata heterogama]